VLLYGVGRLPAVCCGDEPFHLAVERGLPMSNKAWDDGFLFRIFMGLILATIVADIALIWSLLKLPVR
jgi:hypothetical protein